MKKLICMLVVIAISSNVYAGTAYWTGGVKYEGTLVFCHYNYNGTNFWQPFDNSSVCPTTIEI